MTTQPQKSKNLGIASWCFYDWAISAFSTIIVSFIFSAYFNTAVNPAPDSAILDNSITPSCIDGLGGTIMWSRMIAISGLLIAILSPIFGAIADHTGRRKPWLAVMTIICIISTGSLWFIEPDTSFAMPALFIVAIGIMSAELAMVFYNAMLPNLVPENMLGRLSGWGWGLGYVGGIIVLLIALYIFIQPDPPFFGLDASKAEPVRATFILVAIWLAIFSLPLFFFTPDSKPSKEDENISLFIAIKEGLKQLKISALRIIKYMNIVRFLIASALYRDGLNTLFTMGAVFAAYTIGMETNEVIKFGIALNVTAGIGAIAFSWVDDWIGPKKTIIIALIALIILGIPLLIIEDKTIFFWAALPLGIFVGPAQAASRSFLAHIAPSTMIGEVFGLYALTGKAVSFLGPLLFGIAASMACSLRAGMAMIFVLFLAGLLLLLTVKQERPHE